MVYKVINNHTDLSIFILEICKLYCIIYNVVQNVLHLLRWGNRPQQVMSIYPALVPVIEC